MDVSDGFLFDYYYVALVTGRIAVYLLEIGRILLAGTF